MAAIHSPTPAFSKLEIREEGESSESSDFDVEDTIPSTSATPPATNVAATSSLAAVVDDELDRFRSEWKQEVQSRREIGPASATYATPLGSKSPPRRKHKAREKHQRDVPHSTADPTISPTFHTVSPDLLPASSRPAPVSKPLQFPLVAPIRDTGSRNAIPNASAPLVTLTAPSTASWLSKNPFRVPQVHKDQDGAIQLYARAVESEQSGRLNDALLLYRKAFKLDENADRLYARAAATKQLQDDEIEEEPSPTSVDIVDPARPLDEPYKFQRHIQMHPDYERGATVPALLSASISANASSPERAIAVAQSSRPSPLTAIFESLESPILSTDFLPEDETLPIPISRLPPELVEPVLSHLDVLSIERFALTCWRARYLTSVSSVWRKLAEGIYRGPAMVPEGWRARDLAQRHRGEWRTTLVDEERIRMDGCYISVCHYIRPGAGEQWVTITHMITYHRFLRFYPDGSCISFLTTDHPSEVVPNLRPSLRGKGLHFGRWRLVRSDDPLYDHEDDDGTEAVLTKGLRRARVVVTDLLEPGVDVPKYEFEMELGLRETGRGRWNKLDLVNYSSINLATGETLGLSLKHQKPFYFSKVKSYNPPF